MSDSVQPHRWQPTRLLCPWDSPGKNTGVGCHFLLQCMKVKSENEVAQSCPTPSDPIDCSPPGPSVHGIFQARVLEWGAIAFSDLQPRKLDIWASAGGSAVKNPPASAGDVGLIPGSGRSSGEEKGNSVQYSRLENFMDRGA